MVVGGGNVAMDCARSALRMDVKEVHLVYRRTRNEMPADHEEVEAAKKEGVIFHFLTHPTRIMARMASPRHRTHRMALMIAGRQRPSRGAR